MLQRLYIHNFRCLENFEITLKDMSSALLIGRNGSGKSSIASALEVFQKLGRGINRVKELVQPNDFARARSDVPIRFEIEVLLEGKLYKYVLAFELPENFRELRVFEEQLLVAGNQIYSREKAQIVLHARSVSPIHNEEAKFMVDWQFVVHRHFIALPVIQERSQTDPLYIFKTWLAKIIILAPIPSLMTGYYQGQTLEPKRDASNFGEWFSGLLNRYPAAYTQIIQYLGEVMPDLKEVVNKIIGEDFEKTIVRFEEDSERLSGDSKDLSSYEEKAKLGASVHFKDLSDGEKCFFLGAVVLAANEAYGPLFCFWDEPENYLSLSEVGHFVVSLRRSFKKGGQILVTSHNPEAIRKFSNENTWVLDRKSHLRPTRIKLLDNISIIGNLVDALIRDDLELDDFHE